MNDRRRWFLVNLAAIVFVVLVFAAVLRFSANLQPQAHLFGGDFIQEYLGGYIILHGDRSRFYDLDYAIALQHDPAVVGFTWQKEKFLPIIYPPFYYLLVSPLALMPFQTAALLWIGLMALCFAGSVALLARAYPNHPSLLGWALPAAVLFAPLLENLMSSQKATVVLLLLTGTYLLLDRRRPFWAGLVFGLVAFKPQLALVIGLALLCKRQWRFLFGAGTTIAALLGLSLAVGPDVCRQYLQISRGMADYINMPGFQLEKMHCWYGFFKLLLAGWPLTVVQAATLMATALTVVLLRRLLRGPLLFGQPIFALQYAGLVLATIFLSPHLLTYDLTLLLLPMFLLTILLLEHNPVFAGQRRRIIWLLLLLYGLAGVSSTMARLVHVQPTVLLMFALLILMEQVVSKKRPKCAT